jgi:hypothetical protein
MNMFDISLQVVLALAAFAPSPAVALGPDSDGDGVPDALDVCLETPEGTIVDEFGRPLGDLDGDCDVDIDDYALFALNFTGPLECTVEVCDGIDNDCNGVVDDLGTVECGLGPCRRVVERCVGGLPNDCVPGNPSPENCADQIDNDCNGLADCADVVNCPFHTPCSPGISCDHAGSCSCANGFDDCDGNAGNGCERSIRTLTDCGACNVACDLPNATESCSTGTCQITGCANGFDNCDGNAGNGCERSLRTLTNCGACDVVCDFPNATESCSTGTCQFTDCLNGFCNRDGSTPNGCEVNLNLNPACSSATYLGSVSGDVGAGELNASGAGEKWYRATITENDSTFLTPVALHANVVLSISSTVNYDLYIYSACGGDLLGSSTNVQEAWEAISVHRSDTLFQDDTFDILIEIRWYAGGGGSSGGCDWSLRVDGNSTVSVTNYGP